MCKKQIFKILIFIDVNYNIIQLCCLYKVNVNCVKMLKILH